MSTSANKNRGLCLLLAIVTAAMLLPLSSCAKSGGEASAADNTEPTWPDTSRFLVAIEDEPDTVDFQCTTIHYTIAQNVFDRLVEMESDADGNAAILPSLAESWEISEDRCSYTFHLRKGVYFSNGSVLTASDVEYTLVRLLTYPGACNRDIASGIVGATRLERGEADRLGGQRPGFHDHAGKAV